MTALYDKHAATLKGQQDEVRRGRSFREFDQGGNRRKIVQTIGPMHWWDGGSRQWRDIDLQPVEQRDGMWRIDQADYKLIVDPATATLRHESRATGARGRIGLKQVNGLAVTLPVPEIEDGCIRWRNVATDLDLELQLRPNGAQWFKILRSAAAPRRFLWRVERQTGLARERINLDSKGWDATPGSGRAPVRISKSEGTKTTADGWQKWDFTEEWTGEVSRIADQRTRRRAWRTDPRYPVVMDPPDITEDIAANVDDGFSVSFATAWYSNSANARASSESASVQRRVGLRFTTVAVPNGATIDSAKLKLNVTSVNPASGTSRIYADDVDDAAAFANGNLPRGITKTAAFANFAPASAALHTANMTGVVQELVNRGGWASNNDMRFAITPNNGTAGLILSIEDYSAAGTSEAVLEIDYTASASNDGAAMYHHLRNLGVYG